VQFGVLGKFKSAYLFQIAREKSYEYLLIIYMKKFRDCRRNARVSRNHGVRLICHPGRALDLKAKDLIGHL